jgi:micrococcal nuclease
LASVVFYFQASVHFLLNSFNNFKFKRIWALGAIAVSVLLLLVSCEAATPEGETAFVRRVVSGNTIEVLMAAQSPASAQSVRLLGLSAPDLKQNPWGEAAKQALAQLLPPQTPLILETDGEARDAYDRRLAYVWVGDRLINETLLQQGWGLVETRSPHTKYQQRFERAQDYARILGYGIWNPQTPLRQTPAAFRAQN